MKNKIKMTKKTKTPRQFYCAADRSVCILFTRSPTRRAVGVVPPWAEGPVVQAPACG